MQIRHKWLTLWKVAIENFRFPRFFPEYRTKFFFIFICNQYVPLSINVTLRNN